MFLPFRGRARPGSALVPYSLFASSKKKKKRWAGIGAGGTSSSQERADVAVVGNDDTPEPPSIHPDCGAFNNISIQGADGGDGVWFADTVFVRSQSESRHILLG